MRLGRAGQSSSGVIFSDESCACLAVHEIALSGKPLHEIENVLNGWTSSPSVLFQISERDMSTGDKMDAFEYSRLPTKVIFGQGKIDQLPKAVTTMGLQRCMILTTPNQRHLGDRVAVLLGSKAAIVFDQATMHTPLHITEQAMEVAAKAQVDSTVSIGGGSTTGLGKALSIRLGIPQICIPTTYAGSEMTPTLGETVDGRKTTRRDEAIRPNLVIYDVDLTLGLPVRMSLTSGMNAIAHAGAFPLRIFGTNNAG